MRIVIAGAGEAGTYLAKTLSSEKFDVVVIDPDASRLDSLNGYDLLTIADDPLSTGKLRLAGTGKCDMFIALTPCDSENLLLAMIARDMGAACTVARINRDSLAEAGCAEILKHRGVDHLVYPEMLAVTEVEHSLRHPWSRHWSELCDGELLVAAAVVSDDSPLQNLRLSDFSRYSHDFHVSVITRGRETIIPHGDTVIRRGDIAYVSTTIAKESEIFRIFGCRDSRIKKVMVVGGSRIGGMVARQLAGRYDVMLVERDPEHARLLSEEMPQGVVVANGDGRSLDFLEAERVADFDAYLAFTESSEGNIIGCQIAREMGVGKTVAKTISIDLVAEAERLRINTVVNKNLLCAAKIRQILLNSSEEQCMSLAGTNVMVLRAAPGSRVTSAPVRELNIPRGVTLAGYVRDGVAQMVNGSTTLCAGDRVALFMLPGSLISIRDLFK